jgi:CheY-like chemotaxis protein
LLINLAIFARQEMPNGGRWTVDTANVRLDEPFAATHATVKPGPHVRLVLTDTGVGLDKETLQHIFDPSSAKAHGRLAGLSAISAYNIVKQSGGSIWVESDVGRGTRLTIYFPQTDATVEPPAPAPAHAVTQEARVLVVDDEAALRALAAQILARAGYSVRLAASAKEALVELAQASPKFDLLVTDIMMPEMSGTALAVRAIEQQPDLKIMYVSGHVGEGSLASGPIPSGVPFLSKPYSARQLTETARAALAAAREA